MNLDSDLLLRSNLVRAGSTDADIRAATKTGAIERIRRGAFAPTQKLEAMSASERHILGVRAHRAAAGSDLIVSHQSAALLHGIPLWTPDLQRAHFSIARPSGGRRTTSRHVHPAILSPQDVVTAGGLSVTSPDRTVADLCKALPFEAAVCAIDAALYRRLATMNGIREALQRSGVKSTVKAQRAVNFADAGSESIGESRSRVQIHYAGLPVPMLQVDLYSDAGLFIARVDFVFEDFGVIGEFDGRVKYSKYLNPGQSPSDAVVAEKYREDALRSHGWVVVRWTWSDLEHPERLVEKLERAFELASALPRPRTILRPAVA
ncbi:MAG: hypothetical protein WBQ44_22650 [Rhodococcus sp. (in: high G+C Gram-positive bacteria)]